MENTTVVKAKKFALPRFYIRNSRGSDTMTEMNEDLSLDCYVVEDASSSATIEVQEVAITVENNTQHDAGDLQLKMERKVGKTAKATKTPTAYNIFVKTTCEELMTTHVNMTPRERYALAIQMWNDRKKTVASTK